MKKVLMSIHPKWCEKIFNGQKTIEVRRTSPKQLETPFEVVVYQTKIRFKVRAWQENFQSMVFTPNGGAEDGNGKVIGSFVCDRIIDVYVPLSKQAAPLDKEIVERDACLSLSEIQKYAGNKMFLRGLHITKPKLFDKPKELSEFRVVCHRTIHCRACEYVEVVWHEDEQCFYYECRRPSIIRPPQSWCYVEV